MQGREMWVLSEALQIVHGGRAETILGLFRDEVVSGEANERSVCRKEFTEKLSSDSIGLVLIVDRVALDFSHK